MRRAEAGHAPKIGVPIALARWGGRRAEAQRRTAKAGLLASRGRRGNRAGEEGRRRRCGTGGPRQTRRERDPFWAAVEMREVGIRVVNNRQQAPCTAIIHAMLRAFSTFALGVATLTTPPAGAADHDGSGRVAWVTDGDTFRLESGERIRIAGIDACGNAPRPGQMRRLGCTGIAREGPRHDAARGARHDLSSCRSQLQPDGRHVVLDGHDLGTELVQIGVASWWPRGRPKPVWCGL